MSADPDDLTERARRLLNAATPGPWTVDGAWVIADYDDFEVAQVEFETRNRTVYSANAALIAAAPALIADLVTEVERLTAERDHAEVSALDTQQRLDRILAAIGDIEPTNQQQGSNTMTTTTTSDVRIVVLQRGWVVVGRYAEDGDEVTVTDAQVIRRWGTTKGLGELVDGPTVDTVLDPAGTVRAHRLAVVLTLDCIADAWVL